MAAVVCRISKSNILRVANNVVHIPQAGFGTAYKNMSAGRKALVAAVGILGGGAAGLVYALNQSVKATGVELHPAKYPWNHKGIFSTLDHASIRRGYEVYKQVCAACHSMKYAKYRELVNVCFTEAEAKAEAEEIMVPDGPDDEGKMFERPGKLADKFSEPYPNEEAARFANNGSYPPDLTLITLARHGGEDYIFSLLTGYCDAPAGVEVGEGQYYNPYFPGGLIGMAQALYNEAMEYSDGTPATASQMAKDVSTFLVWAGEPHFDDRKRRTITVLLVFAVLIPVSVYYKRHIWSTLKSEKIAFKPLKRSK